MNDREIINKEEGDPEQIDPAVRPIQKMLIAVDFDHTEALQRHIFNRVAAVGEKSGKVIVFCIAGVVGAPDATQREMLQAIDVDLLDMVDNMREALKLG